MNVDEVQKTIIWSNDHVVLWCLQQTRGGQGVWIWDLKFHDEMSFIKLIKKCNKTLPCISHQQEWFDLVSSELFCQVSCHIPLYQSSDSREKWKTGLCLLKSTEVKRSEHSKSIRNNNNNKLYLLYYVFPYIFFIRLPSFFLFFSFPF